MRDEFYAYINSDGLLAMEIKQGKHRRGYSPRGVSNFLIEFVEVEFSLHQMLIHGLMELDIFQESLDVHYDDFLDCKEYCQTIAEGLGDTVGAHFILAELAHINEIPDDETASFLIYQARRMVDALAEPIHTHTFIGHAFQLLFADDSGEKTDRVNHFFSWYPDWREHLFEEVFWVEDVGGTPIVCRRKHIRSYTELMLFCLLALLEQDVNVCRCQCCGGYFCPKTRKTTLYCDRVVRDGRTCKEVAPVLKRRQDKFQDQALAEYDRLYKLYYSRMERYEGRADLHRPRTEKDISQDEFFIWSTKAQHLRLHYLAEDLSAEEFLREITNKK